MTEDTPVPPGPAISDHPGPASVTLREVLREALIEHARHEYPNEACGIVVGDRPAADGGIALRFAPTRNAAASPLRYEIDSADLLRLTLETDDADEAFWAIVHSHVRSPARPSPTDIRAARYPDALYILVSLAEDEADPVTGEPSVRAWRIVDEGTSEVELIRAD
ncbi:MAG: M67 family metallopeptidase [Candidatus Limnocylindrales bacterium]